MDNASFIPLHILAQRLSLPAAWLKSEAEAGRIPSLHAGRRLMFDVDAVKKTLTARTLDDSDHGAPRDD